jgi:Uma2 family endonuclease
MPGSLEEETAMATVEQHLPPLVAGDKLTREEFFRRWEAMPNLKRAELIGGIVYMPSPLSWDHGDVDSRVNFWIKYYAGHTPGCATAVNATWLMGEDAPQPDSSIRILPEYGGRSPLEGRYPRGVPDFLAEVCLSSTAYDLHQKLELYQTEGVQEYLAVLVFEQELRWHRLVDGVYQVVPVSPDGVYRSAVLPGLWLHEVAFMEDNVPQIVATLTQGLNSPEHVAFVEQLARHRRP